MEHAGYDLVVAFPDGSPSFVHGYEAGELGARLKSGTEAEIEKLTVHAANEEVIRRMSIAWGWECEFEQCKDENEKVYETYLVVSLRKVKAEPERRNPHGLRVV
jgi:hypothetical protein